MKPCVFIHTNHKQYLGALVSMHSMRRNSKHADEFDVRLIEYETYQDFFTRYEGRTYSRDGDNRTWDKEDLQSIAPSCGIGSWPRTSMPCSPASANTRSG